MLERGNRLQREGVLRAMSEFFERPVLGGRIGNDLEPMLFYGDMVGQVAAALIAQLADPDPDDPPAGAPGPGDDPRRPHRPSWPGRSRGGWAIPTTRSAPGRPR